MEPAHSRLSALLPHKHSDNRIYAVTTGVFHIGLGDLFDVDKGASGRYKKSFWISRKCVDHSTPVTHESGRKLNPPYLLCLLWGAAGVSCLNSVVHRKTRVLGDQFATLWYRRAWATFSVDVFPTSGGIYLLLPTAVAGIGFVLGTLAE
jgi:hypothetical protein